MPRVPVSGLCGSASTETGNLDFFKRLHLAYSDLDFVRAWSGHMPQMVMMSALGEVVMSHLVGGGRNKIGFYDIEQV